MMTMRRPKTSARAHRAAAVAVAALLQVTALLAVAGAAENTAAETLSESSGKPPLTLTASVGRGYGDHDSEDDERRDKRNDGRNDERGDDGGDRRTDVVPSVGQLISDRTGCSATVITSDSEQLILTAAHCVYIPERGSLRLKNAEPGWVEDVKFIPGRDGREAPYGTWRAERMWVDQRWQTDGEARYDIAVVRIAKNDGKTIQDVVGSQGIDFRADNHDEVVVLGYPGEGRFDGTTQERCVADEIDAIDAIYEASCRDNGGRSGGPWIATFDEKKDLGTIVAVSSFQNGDKDRLGGVAPGRFVRDLIDVADRNDRRNSDDA